MSGGATSVTRVAGGVQAPRPSRSGRRKRLTEPGRRATRARPVRGAPQCDAERPSAGARCERASSGGQEGPSSRRAAPGPAGSRRCGSRAGSRRAPRRSTARSSRSRPRGSWRGRGGHRPGPRRSRGARRRGARWQAQPAAHRPRPQPEMTTVWPSSRTLPIWNTDGLRLLLTEPSPRRSRLRRAGTRCCELFRLSAELRRYLYERHRRSLRVGWTTTSSRYRA